MLSGWLSPPVGIKLSEGAEQLGRFPDVPLANSPPIVAFRGLVEYTGSISPQRKGVCQRTAKMQAALASGRHAEVAIIRMYFQSGFTVSAGGV